MRVLGMVGLSVLALAGTARAQDVSAHAPVGTPHQEQVAAAPEGAKLVPGSFSGTVSVVSDYIFRGISQTDEGAAIQGSLEWKHEAGPFIGVWGSSVDFDDRDQASVELDWYGGYGGEFRAVKYDARAIYYSYPGANVANDYDYWELGLSLGYEPLSDTTVTVGYNYSPDYFAESGDSHYAWGEVKYSLGMLAVPVTVKGGGGRQWIDDNARFGTPDYWHWSAGLAVTIQGVDLSVTYSDTDIKHSECGAALDVCGARVIFAAAYGL